MEKVEPFESASESFISCVPDLFQPFQELIDEGLDKTAKSKARELLEDPRLENLTEAT
jgi:hypothetical protein